jgi:enamine deaminase RidA (YjgF/YER057c/UK114 family)
VALNSPSRFRDTVSSAVQYLRSMTERQKISTGAKWESIVGYSRAVRVGNRVYMTGTTGIDESGNIVGEGDGYAQTVQVIRNIERALQKVGATLEHVVRTRMFVTDIKRWQEYGRAHNEFFGSIRPCATMVEVRALIDPRMLIEMEIEAEL